MKANTINVQITKNLGNYETIRIGGDWSLEAGETEAEAIAKASAMLEEAFFSMYYAPNFERKKTARFGTPELDALLQRIERGGVSWEMVQAWYILPTPKEVNAVRLALDMNREKADATK